MKYLLLLLIVSFVSCTDNEVAKNYGGTEEVTLAPNTQLVNVTWKETNMWMLTKPADSNFIPKTYHFKEKSSYGVWEGTIVIKETK